ncbi:YaaC family protein [Streptomyces angustmyceticus]|uniref:YaaC family protein n=1 Tax=Streptomyces angustmyceticus TaxID=285578 RepID=UPI0037F3B8F9
MVRRPYPTHRDMTYPPTEAVWRALRELRATPPGYATSGQRRKVFSAAIEQAEQLFRAASTVGPASRPVLLYYGLSQAGRAIAACAPVSAADYPLQGHGLGFGNKEQPDVGKVTVKDKGSGNQVFLRVAEILGSRSLPSDTRVADLWSAILEVEHWPLSASSKSLMHVSSEISEASSATLTVMISGLPRALQEPTAKAEIERVVTDYLREYPTLAGYSFRHPGVFPAHGPESSDERQGTIGCRLTWPVGQHSDAQAQKFDELAPWRGRSLTATSRVLHARFGGDDRQLHPLLTWWAVLYALSMLARYQPDQWTTQIDVNRSKDAVNIEYLLDSALSTVPELVLAAIDEVTGGVDAPCSTGEAQLSASEQKASGGQCLGAVEAPCQTVR